MAKSVVLKAELRKGIGSKSTRKLREEGKVPAVVYGHKEEPVSIAFDQHEFMIGLHQGGRLFDVQIGSNNEKLLIKDLQYDHLGKSVIHADFVRVDLSETVKVSVPIVLKGTAKGAQSGGMLEEHLDHLEVECRVTDIPESITILVKDLDVGSSVHARDVSLPEGVKLLTSPESLVVACRIVLEVKTTEELEAATPTAPEVIGKAKEEAAEEAEPK